MQYVSEVSSHLSFAKIEDHICLVDTYQKAPNFWLVLGFVSTLPVDNRYGFFNSRSQALWSPLQSCADGEFRMSPRCGFLLKNSFSPSNETFSFFEQILILHEAVCSHLKLYTQTSEKWFWTGQDDHNYKKVPGSKRFVTWMHLKSRISKRPYKLSASSLIAWSSTALTVQPQCPSTQDCQLPHYWALGRSNPYLGA